MQSWPGSADKHVLVVGGGVAGISAISALRAKDKEVKITLVNAKEYGEILWASYRSPFVEEVAKGSLIRLPKYCAANNVTFVLATVTNLISTTCEASLLESGEATTINFDVCVVATGANADWKGMGRDLPTTLEESKAETRLKAMKAEGERLMKAASVVIVGGGLIGCELAGDLVSYSRAAGKSTSVTLAHSGPHLGPIDMNERAAKTMESTLEGLGVKIVLQEKATESQGKVTLSSSKEVIDADVVVKTIGFSPVNSFLQAGLPEALDERGWIKTDKHFVVPGSDGKVFAFGDCSSTLPNAAAIYMETCGILGHNIHVTLTGSQVPMMEVTEHKLNKFVATLGPQNGIYQIGSSWWGKRFIPWFKNWTMFLFSVRVNVNVKDEYKVSYE